MMRLYNTLTQHKEQFQPLSDKKVSMYVCGITPYDTTHLGHAFTYIVFDLLLRTLKQSGYAVIYTQNVTDINDRDNDILKRAKEQHTPWNQLAEYWTNRFLSDMKALNWIQPTHYLHASKNIQAMITLINEIIKKGIGYEVRGNVYLDITKKTDFGKLSRLTPEQMIERAKLFEEDITNPNKLHPLDITLWRASEPSQPAHIPSFDSPWGKGRPGWHIECSAMAIETLGPQIDIHGGGIDLIYPHHESEIAQSESATGKSPFVKYWIHTGTMRIGGEKMSKSLGNLILVNDLLHTYSANAIRWVLLSHHYREPWDYDEKEFIVAETLFTTIRNILQKKYSASESTQFKETIISTLHNDLDSPTALITITEAAKELEITNNKQLQEDIRDILTVLGFTL